MVLACRLFVVKICSDWKYLAVRNLEFDSGCPTIGSCLKRLHHLTSKNVQATTLARQMQTDVPTTILLSWHNKTRNYQQKNDFRIIFTPLHSVYHSNINTILVAVGVKLCPKGVSVRITYLLATSFAARLGDLLRPQRLKLRTSSFYMSQRSTSVQLYNGHFDIHTHISTNHSTALQLRFWRCHAIG